MGTNAENAQLGGRTLATRRGREYMATIGRRGGQQTSQDRAHMREIARRSVQVRAQHRQGTGSTEA